MIPVLFGLGGGVKIGDLAASTALGHGAPDLRLDL